MPINELEKHPYLNYLQQGSYPEINNYKGLIIGSFPVYSCTDTINEDLDVVEQRFVPEDVTMRFFYGSRRSGFWDYCAAAFREPNPTVALPNDEPKISHIIARERAIELLKSNCLLITDVIKQTNRREYGDEDSNLWITNNASNFISRNIALNSGIINILEEHTTIQNLYFTATGLRGKSPFGWFRKIFNGDIRFEIYITIGRRTWSMTCLINQRKFNVFMLPTPKSRGVHFSDNQRTQMFVNYLRNQMNDFYNEISIVPRSRRTNQQESTLSIARRRFLIECYRQALVLNNLDFEGSLQN
jgi:hypothetical protein